MSQAAQADLERKRRYDRLVGAHRADLFRYAYWLNGDAALAEDVVQDAMVRAWRSLDNLREDAAAPPLAAREVRLIDAILGVRGRAADALERLMNIALDLPAIDPAVSRLSARLAAIEAHGIDAAALPFEASYGRTQMEYYDGFVFGFTAEPRPDLPPVATGGRYDALTRQLGHGREIPAIGGVIRPGLTLALRGDP